MSTPTHVLDGLRAGIAATNAIFVDEVVGKGNFQLIDQVYTAGARILPPGAPMISGREAIRDFWKSAVAAMGVTSCSLSTVDLMTAGDGAVEIGKAEIVTPSATIGVKYVVHWLQEDGRWKWNIDIWNPNA
jgi:ketosteroid isomerase-like protein